MFVTEVVCDSVQFLEPKNAQQNGGQRQQNEFQDYGQGFGGQQSGQNNCTIIHQTRNNLIIHLQMQTDRLISVMMTYHSNKN